MRTRVVHRNQLLATNYRWPVQCLSHVEMSDAAVVFRAGSPLKPEAFSVRIIDRYIYESCMLSINISDAEVFIALHQQYKYSSNIRRPPMTVICNNDFCQSRNHVTFKRRTDSTREKKVKKNI
jgi:hypothetical protein